MRENKCCIYNMLYQYIFTPIKRTIGVRIGCVQGWRMGQILVSLDDMVPSGLHWMGCPAYSIAFI